MEDKLPHFGEIHSFVRQFTLGTTGIENYISTGGRLRDDEIDLISALQKLISVENKKLTNIKKSAKQQNLDYPIKTL